MYIREALWLLLNVTLFTWAVLAADENDRPIVLALSIADDVCASHFHGTLPHRGSVVARHKPLCMHLGAALGTQNAGARVSNLSEPEYTAINHQRFLNAKQSVYEMHCSARHRDPLITRPC